MSSEKRLGPPPTPAEADLFAQLVAEELAMRQGAHRQPAREMVVYPVGKGYAYYLIDAFGYTGVSFPLTLLGNGHGDLVAALRFLDAHNVGYDLGPLVDVARSRGLPVRLGGPPGPEPLRPVKVVGLGQTGGAAAEFMALEARAGVEVWAIDIDPVALQRRQVPRKHLGREGDWRPLPFLDSADAVVLMAALEEPAASLMADLALAAWAGNIPALGVVSGAPLRLGSDVGEAFDAFLALTDANLSSRFGSVPDGISRVALRLMGPRGTEDALGERIRRAKRR